MGETTVQEVPRRRVSPRHQGEAMQVRSQRPYEPGS